MIRSLCLCLCLGCCVSRRFVCSQGVPAATNQPPAGSQHALIVDSAHQYAHKRANTHTHTHKHTYTHAHTHMRTYSHIGVCGCLAAPQSTTRLLDLLKPTYSGVCVCV